MSGATTAVAVRQGLLEDGCTNEESERSLFSEEEPYVEDVEDSASKSSSNPMFVVGMSKCCLNTIKSYSKMYQEEEAIEAAKDVEMKKSRG